jgi:hypothetical protein
MKRMLRCVQDETPCLFDPRLLALTAVFAAGHNGFVEALAHAIRQFIDFVRAINLDRLFGGVERYFAVLAPVEVFLQLGTRLGRHCVVD